LAIFNSVTKEYAILVDFVILRGKDYIILPKQVTAFRKKHTGKAKEILQNYENVLGKIKESWKDINEKFSREISQNEREVILRNIKLGSRINKTLEEKFAERSCELWEFFIEVIKIISNKKYKNEINRIKKLKIVSNSIFRYAILENLKE
jgi:hypothetical protein